MFCILGQLLSKLPIAIYGRGRLRVWRNDKFISPLLTSEVFLSIKIPRKQEETPYAQQVIYAGLCDITNNDFNDIDQDFFPVESAVGFRLAYNVAFSSL